MRGGEGREDGREEGRKEEEELASSFSSSSPNMGVNVGRSEEGETRRKECKERRGGRERSTK